MSRSEPQSGRGWLHGWVSPGFLRFLARRFAAFVLLLFGITFIAFILTQLVPANPALASLGIDATPDAIQAYDERYGLNEPLPAQYLHYLDRLLHGDLGVSQQTQNPVSHDLTTYFPATAELAIMSIAIAILIGGTFGIIAALKRDSFVDYSLRLVSLIGVSIPVFWLALVMIYLLFFKYGIFPGSGRLDVGTEPPPHITGLYTVDSLLAGDWSTFWDALRHLFLPAFVLAAFNVAVLTRYTRSSVLEVLHQDYVRAAIAKGLPQRTIVLRYVLRAALPALLTILGLMFASVLTGAVLVENIFSWPGLGQYGYQAATSLDLPAIMGVSLCVATIYIATNFVVDVLYSVLDPRIRLTE